MEIKYYSLILPIVCFFVFLLQTFIPGFTELFLLNDKAFFEVWRFLTSIFLHGGLGHLLYNCFAIAFFGIILEKTIGSNKFISIYLISGIFANLVSVNFYNSSLGASGAIMGIIGVLALIRPFMMVWSFGMILPMFLVSLIWIAGDIFGVFFPSNVGNIAHLSGMALGLVYGLYLKVNTPKENKPIKLKIPNNYLENWEDKYMGES